MAGELLPNLHDEIIIKILQLIGEQSFYYLGDFLRAGKRGYELVHEPSVLKICDVTEMVSFCSSQISNHGRFRVFFRKCLNAGNTRAICYDGLQAATILGLEESIKILEPNVPKHPLSTFAQVIFKVCLGRDKEASQVFQLFAAHHADLRSEEVLDLGRSMQYLMPHFYAPWLNTYAEYLILLCFKTLKNKDMSGCMAERSSPSRV
ncbi:BnaC07g06870D [Brassica napus]|uniref:BnaC07g06870D protein n=1 Tax=Brassica napus TaxID=3708 RepID=A0A078G854_BRANA|nr:BnaC07g06870D [Brassica napus]